MAAVSPELEIIARIEAKGDAVLAELREHGADDRRILNHLALRMAENTEELREQRLAWRVEFRNQSEARRRDLDEERERWRLEVEARLEERREDREERREESEARRGARHAARRARHAARRARHAWRSGAPTGSTRAASGARSRDCSVRRWSRSCAGWTTGAPPPRPDRRPQTAAGSGSPPWRGSSSARRRFSSGSSTECWAQAGTRRPSSGWAIA